ncbi:hypothetical protein M0657_000899 [Pyricularia oryzae]|nr:hypothetical protein M9X92_009297 [Pyricularia oryzae]KAI7931885.1 hypothetical protein M0657_000899 [Pyricularia oryzae]
MSCLAGGVLREEGLSQEDRPDKQAIAWMKLIAGTFITRAGCPEEIIQSGWCADGKKSLKTKKKSSQVLGWLAQVITDVSLDGAVQLGRPPVTARGCTSFTESLWLVLGL